MVLCTRNTVKDLADDAEDIHGIVQLSCKGLGKVMKLKIRPAILNILCSENICIYTLLHREWREIFLSLLCSHPKVKWAHFILPRRKAQLLQSSKRLR